VKQRLAARLVLSHALVTLVVVGVTGFGLLPQIREYFVDADRRALIVQAQVAADSCDAVCLETASTTARVAASALPSAANVAQNQANSADNLNIAPLGAPEAQSQVSANLGSRIRVIRTTDLGDTYGPQVRAALDGRSSSMQAGQQLYAAVPIRRNGRVLGAIEARGDLRNVDAVLSDLRQKVFIALAIGALIGVLIGLWRARKIARPVNALTIAANALADGNFAYPLPTAKGNDELAELTRSFGSMRDRVQHELAVRNAFVADASHELRTPLSAIRGAVEILQDGAAERPEARTKFLNTVKRETDRLVLLTEGLLTLETSSQNPIDTSQAPSVHLVSLVETVVAELQPFATTHDLRLELHVDDDVRNAHCRGSAPRIHQVIVNLLNNAIAYSPAGQPIEIRFALQDECKHAYSPTGQRAEIRPANHREHRRAMLNIDVVDRGPGIPEADRERIFERFVRTDVARSRNSGGAGLGLPIARAIAEAHGGTISMHSGADGVGNIARLALPVVP
jgi:signal transduction histidine kinase